MNTTEPPGCPSAARFRGAPPLTASIHWVAVADGRAGARREPRPGAAPEPLQGAEVGRELAQRAHHRGRRPAAAPAPKRRPPGECIVMEKAIDNGAKIIATGFGDGLRITQRAVKRLDDEIDVLEMDIENDGY